MKPSIITVAILAILPPAFAAEQPLLARVTVYWASGGKGSDRYTRHHQTAVGCRLKEGHCAVDPRHIPYGSKVVLGDGSTLAAVDTGTAVINRKAARKAGRTPNERNAIVIDRFFETKRQAMAWASSHPLFMPVKVLPPNARSVAATTNTAAAFTAASPVAKAIAVVKPTPRKYALLASNDTAARSPLNRLGR